MTVKTNSELTGSIQYRYTYTHGTYMNKCIVAGNYERSASLHYQMGVYNYMHINFFVHMHTDFVVFKFTFFEIK